MARAIPARGGKERLRIKTIIQTALLLGAVSAGYWLGQKEWPGKDDSPVIPMSLAGLEGIKPAGVFFGQQAWVEDRTGLFWISDAATGRVISGYIFDRDGRNLHPEKWINAPDLPVMLDRVTQMPGSLVPPELEPDMTRALGFLDRQQRFAKVGSLLAALSDVRSEDEFNTAMFDWMSDMPNWVPPEPPAMKQITTATPSVSALSQSVPINEIAPERDLGAVTVAEVAQPEQAVEIAQDEPVPMEVAAVENVAPEAVVEAELAAEDQSVPEALAEAPAGNIGAARPRARPAGLAGQIRVAESEPAASEDVSSDEPLTVDSESIAAALAEAIMATAEENGL